MSRPKCLAVLGFLLIGISAKAQKFPASLNTSKPWSFSVDIAAPDGTYIMNAPETYLLGDGRLLVIVPLNKYVTDAVTKGIKYAWLVSEDGGISWEPLKKRPADFLPIDPHDYPTDQVHPRALKLSDGTLLATTSAGYENFPESDREKLIAEGYAVFGHKEGNAPGIVSVINKVVMSRSRNGGKTWEIKDLKLPFMAKFALYGNAIVLKDGTYVQPAEGVLQVQKDKSYRGSSLALRTEDGGEHWEISTVAKGKDFDFNETSITQAPNGDLVAVIRTTSQKELWTAISKDDGKTWSAPRDSGMRGSTPWVVTTNKGLVVAVYSRRSTKLFPTTGMYACVSRDNGQSWDVKHQAMIRDNGTAVVDGYPQAVALPDGSVFAVYGLMLSAPAQVTMEEKSADGQLHQKLSNAQLNGQATPRKKSIKSQLSIVATRFSPLYQGPPVFSFDDAPGVLK